MTTRPLPPIQSTRSHDPEAEVEIDAFIYGLGELVDTLQDMEAAGDLLRLAETAGRLAQRSRELGFAPLADAGETLRTSCRSSEADAARKAVEELTELAQRALRGHRSSAS